MCRPAPVHWFLGQKFDLADQEALLVGELVIVGAVFQKFGQESKESVAIVDKNPLDGHRFVRIGHEYLCWSVACSFPLDRRRIP